MRLSSTFRRLAEQSLLLAPRAAKNGDRLVLAYHNVVPAGTGSVGDASLHLPVQSFAEQLGIIQREASLVSLEELLSSHASHNERLVAITFDDAYRSALDLALPLCAAAGVGATVFVSPDLLGTTPHWDAAATRGAWTPAGRTAFLWEEKGRCRNSSADDNPTVLQIATAEQLSLSMASGRHRLGNHTMSHSNLGSLSWDEVVGEIRSASHWLSSRFPALTLPVMAYPYGIPPKSPENLNQVADVEVGFTVAGGWMRSPIAAPPFLHSRWNVPAGISSDGFRLRLRGWLAGN